MGVHASQGFRASCCGMVALVASGRERTVAGCGASVGRTAYSLWGRKAGCVLECPRVIFVYKAGWLSVAVAWLCKMACTVVRNGPFGIGKQAVLPTCPAGFASDCMPG